MTTTQEIITIAAVIAGTMLTRFIPFMLFSEKRTAPAYIRFLGKVLPFAMIALLVIYCLKDSIYKSHHGLPDLIAIIFIVLIHKWKKNTLLSIASGTVFYMILVQNFFI